MNPPFVIHRNPTLWGLVRYDTPQAGMELHGAAMMVAVEPLADLRIAEELADGTLLMSFCVERSNALRGRWVAVVKPAAEMLRIEETLRLSEGLAIWNTEESWVHTDDPSRSPVLERARWLSMARMWSHKAALTSDEVSLLRTAHERCGDDWMGLALGRALIVRDDHAGALAVFAQMDSACTTTDEARALVGLERFEDAVRVIDAVPLDEHTSKARALWLRGRALAQLGRDEEAMRSLLSALDALDPSDQLGLDKGSRMDGLPGAVRMSVAIEGVRMGRFEDALKGCENDATLLIQGQCLEALGRVAEARDRYEQARSLHPKEAIAALLALEKNAALSTPRSTAKTTAIDLGDKVTHAKLGDGEVIDVEDGSAPRLLVAFENGAEKWLAVSAVRRL